MPKGAIRPRYVFLLGFLPNPRIERRIEVACRFAQVDVIAWDRTTDALPVAPESRSYRLHRLSHPATSNPLRRFGPLTGFLAEACALVRRIEPDAIHVQGLDVAMLALLWRVRGALPSRARGRRPVLVYEVADLHRMIESHQPTAPRRLLRALLDRAERAVLRACDLLVLTSEGHYEARYRRHVERERTVVVPNVSGALELAGLPDRPSDGTLRIGYFGVVRQKDQLRHLFEAAEASGVHVTVAGIEMEPQVLREAFASAGHVEWRGAFRKEDLPDLYAQVDLTYCVYDASRENYRTHLANKLFEAIAAARPVIVARGTYMARLVEQWGVGFAVAHDGGDELAAELAGLQADPARLERMRQACRRTWAELSAHEPYAELESRLRALLT